MEKVKIEVQDIVKKYGKEYKEMVGEEIIKRHNRRQSPLLKQ